ncbi:MAG: TetR/AcrR family transcriptional regulator [Gammaproteobacteria bacterium]|nr:TetR/AcrR family transcriptional regulator [Gammaproteobacteria bacterium]MCB1924949.1 TetR/AcrR family transcriptional regulator [Gammaproteobacteria bacterium]
MNAVSDTRERILDAARRLIYARSYADVGIAEICAEAGVKKGSFYHFFPSKRDLTVAILDATFADLKSDLLDRAFAADVSPLARLRRLIDLTVRSQTEMHAQTGVVPGCQFGNLAAEQSTQDEVLRNKVAEVFGRLAKGLAATLTQAVAEGEVGPIDVAATADAMLAYLEGVVLIAKSRNDPGVLARLLPGMLDIRIMPAAS